MSLCTDLKPATFTPHWSNSIVPHRDESRRLLEGTLIQTTKQVERTFYIKNKISHSTLHSKRESDVITLISI